MGKRYVLCPFCWEKIKEKAIKCMYCKKWLNTEENLNYHKEEKIETEIIENSNKIEKIIKNSNEVSYVDKSILWWIIWFQVVCVLWALVNVL